MCSNFDFFCINALNSPGFIDKFAEGDRSLWHWVTCPNPIPVAPERHQGAPLVHGMRLQLVFVNRHVQTINLDAGAEAGNLFHFIFDELCDGRGVLL